MYTNRPLPADDTVLVSTTPKSATNAKSVAKRVSVAATLLTAGALAVCGLGLGSGVAQAAPTLAPLAPLTSLTSLDAPQNSWRYCSNNHKRYFWDSNFHRHCWFGHGKHRHHGKHHYGWR